MRKRSRNTRTSQNSVVAKVDVKVCGIAVLYNEQCHANSRFDGSINCD